MMDHKIAFIYCVNDPLQYEESIAYAGSLSIPQGYEIDFIPVEHAPSMTAGYNQAMNRSDAKYKVYLHQDVCILNSNFLSDMVTLFKNNENIGMMGVIGSKTIPENGIWWESSEGVGKVYDSHSGKMELIAFAEILADFERVQAVDGLLMATQYDLSWREDLFTGWHFYDLSQSMEFRKAGYEIAIPKQEKPWCLHDSGIVHIGIDYAKAQEIFCAIYLK
ncbi:MAG TPA: glycosyltransferase family protein [Bacilli bacterium]